MPHRRAVLGLLAAAVAGRYAGAAGSGHYAAILAARQDGPTMSIRDKGPIRVMYPMDKEPALGAETIHTRPVWQVKSRDVS